LYILTQSEGTGFVAGGFFSFAFGAAAFGDAPAAVEEELLAVLAAGFCAQPAATKARTLTSNRIFLIDPPERNIYLRLSAMELIRAVWIGRKLTRPIVVVYRIEP
jgi:hypothetical protein